MVGGGYHRFCTPAPHCPTGHCFVPKFGISHPTTHRMPSPQSGAPWVQKPCAKVQGCACMSWEGFQSMEKQICQKADSTLRSSQAVPHPSTNRALCCLTSEVERDPVHSTRYGRRRKYATAHAYNSGQKEPRCAIVPICSVFVLLHFHQAHEVQESHTAQSHIITDLCCSKMSTIHSGHY